ncbi:MAG: hypothetical protein LBH03_04315 [Holophagales bacterium]|jgi:hypothetical protein|nr:hypothetical protein [Holophagales bacterium]
MAIDREKIITELSKLDLRSDEKGIISGFGVLLQHLPATIWTLFSERFTRAVPNELLEAAEYLLVDAAHECAYHTGYGIITSEEWKAVVEPMIKTTEDILHGAFAIFTAWGWGKVEIQELIPGEKLVLRAYDYYEADVVEYGKSSKMSAYLITGASAAFMDLAYGGNYDPTGKKGLGTFEAKQVKGIECGDDYGEVVVTKI